MTGEDENQPELGIMTLARHLVPYRWLSGHEAPGTCLEIGVGTGYGAQMLIGSGFDVIGLDLMPRNLVRTRQRLGGAAALLAGDALLLPFRDRSLPVIFAFQVIEHLVHPERLLSEIVRVLAPGGRAYLTTPNAAIRCLPLQRARNPWHVREYRADELAVLLRRAFANVRLMAVTADDELMAFERSRLRQNPLRAYAHVVLTALGLERAAPPGDDHAAIAAGPGDAKRAEDLRPRFHVVENARDDHLDIFAVCHAPA